MGGADHAAGIAGSHLSNKDLAPTTAEQRTWGTYNLAALWVGLSIVILNFGQGSPMIQIVPSAGWRRLVTGFLFGTTGTLITLSPLGRESGAHINPVVTLAFWLMGKLSARHAAWYVLAQMIGAALGAAPLLAWGAMGSSVAIDRDAAGGTGFIVLGAPGRAVDGTPGGGAFVYSSPPGASVYAFEALIQHPDAVASDRFGSAVGVDGDRIVVGADGRARIDTVPDEGRGYVFERRVLLGNTDWPWRQDLRFPGLGNVNLGRALAMSRNMVVLGAPSISSDNGGLAVVYACDLIFADGFLAATSAQSCALP